MKLLPAHRRLSIIAVLILAGWGVAYYFLVYPLQAENRRLNDDRAQQVKDLTTQKIPSMVPAKLAALRDDAAKQKWELQKQLRAVYQRVDVETELHKRIVQEYSSLDGFRHTGSVLSYQDKFGKLKEELAKNNVFLGDGAQLGISETTVSDNIYQLMMQLWLIGEVANLAHTHSLDLADPDWRPPPPGAEGTDKNVPKVPIARLAVLPVKAYKPSKDSPPFFEEYPVRLTVSGSWDQVNTFMLDLTEGGRFLPLDEVLITVHKPPRLAYRSERVDATLVVSAFLILTDNLDQLLPADSGAPQHNMPPWSQGK